MKGVVEMTPSTRQERRTARRKAQILEAAAKVFAEKGFHRTTTKDIAEVAHIAEGTIYNYFESKDDLLINLIYSFANLEARRETYAQSLDADFRPAFHDMMLQRFAIVKDRNTLLMAILQEIIVTPHLRELYKEQIMTPAMRDMEEHLKARIERGHLGDIDVPIVIRMLTALGLGLEVLSMLGDEETSKLWNDPSRLVDLAMQVAFEGIFSIPAQSAGSSE